MEKLCGCAFSRRVFFKKLSKMESITNETNTHFVNDKDLEI